MLFLYRTMVEPPVWFKAAIVSLLCAGASLMLAVASLQWLGWLILGGLALALVANHTSRFAQHMLLLTASIGLLGITPINTDISYGHMIGMGTALAATVLVPFIVTTYGLHERTIRFPLRFGRKWQTREILYVIFAGFAAYLVLPFYLASTGSYLNWTVGLDPSHIMRLFIGTNGLGIWDEVFFIGVCLALLRQHLPFIWANLAQAVLWTAFLYELGFRGWGPGAVFVFALSQGYIFKHSNALLYIIAVHLIIDFVHFLALLHLHYPDYLRLFITSPFL